MRFPVQVLNLESVLCGMWCIPVLMTGINHISYQQTSINGYNFIQHALF